MFKIYEAKITKDIFLKKEGFMKKIRFSMPKEVENFNGDICDGCRISSELILEDGVHIAMGVKIVGKGKVYIGKGSTIAPGVVIYTSMPNLKKATNGYCEEHSPIVGDVRIGKNVFIGSNAVIGCGCEILDDTVVQPCENIKPKTIFKRSSKWQL